jgi:hypothetical protein
MKLTSMMLKAKIEIYVGWYVQALIILWQLLD